MAKKMIDKLVSRSEGDGVLKVALDDDGKIKNIQNNIATTRFFEKILEGRYCEHINRITPRICGSCSIPHHLAPTKAVEDAWGVEIPITALKLRKLLINAKQYSSHALHFYGIAAPDFLLGPKADQGLINIVKAINKIPDLGAMALNMINFGQKISATVGGKSVHPISAIVGGMRKPLDEFDRDNFLKQIEDQMKWTEKTMETGLKIIDDHWDVIVKVGNVPTYYVGMTNNGIHDIYEGNLRIVTLDGNKKDYDFHKYQDCLGVHIPEHAYAKHMYYKPEGYPKGVYRSGPLGNINAVDKMATPLAEGALKALREKIGPISHPTFIYHWARLIELMESIETIKSLLEDPDIVNPDCKTLDIQPKEGEGIGLVGAPHGLLLYHIWSDQEGICKKANLLVQTNHNIAGIEKTILHFAKQVSEDKALDNLKIPDPWLK